MKTIKFLALLLWAVFVANCLSCAPKAFPVDTPNPLDTPVVSDGTPTIRQSHLRAITGNQGYR